MRPRATGDSMAPAFTGDELRAQLARYDRQPFIDVLSAWLQCAPTPEEVMAFAAKKPDMYIKAVGDLARMAGFTDKREVDVSVSIRLDKLSDSQLEDRAKRLLEQLQMAPVIDGEAVEDAVIVEDDHNTE